VLMVAMVPLMGTGSAVVVKGGFHASEGDYIKYDVDAEKYMESIMAASPGGGEMNVNVEKAVSELRFTGTEDINVNGTVFNCVVAEHSMELMATFDGSYQGMDISMDIHIISEEKQWIDSSDGAIVRMSETQYSYTNSSMSGGILGDQSSYMATKTVTETTYNPPMKNIDRDVEAGDVWNESSTSTIKTTVYSYENGEWTAMGGASVETETETEHYEAIGDATITTVAGTFQTLKIKSWSDDDSGNYSVIYMTEEGAPVKMEMYDSTGDVSMSVEATEYHYSEAGSSTDDGEESSSTPGFMAIMTISAIGMVVIAYSIRRK